MFHSASDWRSAGLQLFAVLAFVGYGLCRPVETAANEAYVPTDDSEVLETLPRSPLFSRDQMATIRERLAAEPENAKLAATAAYGYLQMGKSTGDPRFYGYARAAIQSWWDKPDAPSLVLMQRAKIKERDHRYEDAIADLKLVAQREPRNAQAWIELSNLYRVIGDFEAAWQASDTLNEFADQTVGLVSRAPLMAANGQAEAALRLVTDLLGDPNQQAELIPWAKATQASTARLLARSDEADRHYQEALRLSPDDVQLKRSYADFLLDQNQPEDALSLVEKDTNDNGALLLAAIAARRSGKLDLANDLQGRLANRFNEMRLRGGQPHGRFEARYLLELEDSPAEALAVAKANWEKQKETRDTRNVLEAAIAAQQPEEAEVVLAYLKQCKSEDVQLLKLAKQLEGQQ